MDSTTSKPCSLCKKTQPLDQYKSERFKGEMKACITCRTKEATFLKAKREGTYKRISDIDPNGEKKCNTCDLSLVIKNNYYKARGVYFHKCKKCYSHEAKIKRLVKAGATWPPKIALNL